MSEWKSSDGGSITPLGASSATLTASGTIVASGANTKGVTIRTAALGTWGGTGQGRLTAGGVSILEGHGTNAAMLPREVFVPAGVAIAYVLVAGATSLGVTYDIH